jgi:hypothetical protein
MYVPEKWRSGCVSGFPECTRIFLSPCLSVISVAISALSVSGALGTCAITLIHNYMIIKADAAALQCP